MAILVGDLDTMKHLISIEHINLLRRNDYLCELLPECVSQNIIFESQHNLTKNKFKQRVKDSSSLDCIVLFSELVLHK